MAESGSELARLCHRLARDPDARPVAGGTDLMVASVVERARRGPLVDISQRPELAGVAEAEGVVSIGAAETFSELQESRLVRRHFPALAAAAAEVGGWQIQNRATLGGNVANASPAGDSLPVLLALDATVVCVRATTDGEKLVERRVSYDQFHLGYRETVLAPGELIARFELPVPPEGTRQVFRKVGTREAQAISKVVLAMVGRLEEGTIVTLRLAAGSVAATPIRLRAAEQVALGGQPPEVAEAAAEAARGETHPIDDVRSTAEYRSLVLGRLVRRFVASLG